MTRIGRQLLNDSKAAVAASEKTGEKNSVRKRDLLSLLVRANTATDLSDSQRMSDEDVLARKCPITNKRKVIDLILIIEVPTVSALILSLCQETPNVCDSFL